MDSWDVPAADAAIAALARTAGGNEIFEEFFRYGARDFAPSAIRPSSSPTVGGLCSALAGDMRSRCYARWPMPCSIMKASPTRPTRTWDRISLGSATSAWPVNSARTGWRESQDNAATQELLATLRSGSNSEACDKVLELINRGVSPQSVWDGLFLGAGELMMRQPGIVSLHALTTTNAMRFAYGATSERRDSPDAAAAECRVPADVPRCDLQSW